jgi:hypothetical protein
MSTLVAFELVDALPEPIFGFRGAFHREPQAVQWQRTLLCQPRKLGLGSTKYDGVTRSVTVLS